MSQFNDNEDNYREVARDYNEEQRQLNVNGVRPAPKPPTNDEKAWRKSEAVKRKALGALQQRVFNLALDDQQVPSSHVLKSVITKVNQQGDVIRKATKEMLDAEEEVFKAMHETMRSYEV